MRRIRGKDSTVKKGTCRKMAREGDTIKQPRPRSRSRAIRLALVVGVLALGAGLSWGPFHAYLEARDRLGAQQREVAQMEQESKELTESIARLREPATVEMLARTQISYAHPGERVYVLMDPPAEPEGLHVAPSLPKRGPLERLVIGFRGLF